MKHLVVALAALAVLGCSSPDSEEQHSADESVAAKGDPQAREAWKWAGDGEARDPVADDGVCRAKTDPDSPPLAQVQQYGACMVSKGWVPNRKQDK